MLWTWYTNPPGFNRTLNAVETFLGRGKLWSYPAKVCLTLTNFCNQECRFCGYDPHHLNPRADLDPELIGKMRWLRLVSEIWLSGGIGEPLAHPRFLEIVEILRRIAPRARLNLGTNGLLLSGTTLDCLPLLDRLDISVNAATETTYRSVIRGGDFARLMHNLETVSRRKPRELFVRLTVVLTRATCVDVAPLIDLATRLGFDSVGVYPYLPMDGGGKLPAEDSPSSNATIEQGMQYCAAYAERKGIGFGYSQYAAYAIGTCHAPWHEAYLGISPIGTRNKFRLCCSGLDVCMTMDPSVCVHFKRLWNSERLQHIRRTVNAREAGQNNLCWSCRVLHLPRPTSYDRLRQRAHVERPDIVFETDHAARVFPRIHVV